MCEACVVGGSVLCVVAPWPAWLHSRDVGVESESPTKPRKNIVALENALGEPG